MSIHSEVLLFHTLHLIFVVSIVSTQNDYIRLEWSLGDVLPVSKMLNLGTEQDLFCSVDETQQLYPVLLQCPMYQGICMENCNPNEENLHISCTNMTENKVVIFRYRLKVFKNYEGLWKCQYKSAISRAVELSVTNKPYIVSLTSNPNPVWKGSRMNITCQVLPMPGISGIQFYRVYKDNTTSIIPNEYSEGKNVYSESIIINSATPDMDDNIQCMVYAVSGMITTKTLANNILYFPSRITLTASSNDDNYAVGSSLRFHCSANGGNPKPVLHIYRQRQQEEPEKLREWSVVLTKLDNLAIYYCKMERQVGVVPKMQSNEISVKVRYPPDNIQLSAEPSGELRESQIQSFVCLSIGGSEPRSQIEWTMSDPFGKKVSTFHLSRIIERIEDNNNTSPTLKDSIKITMLRDLNGYTISCSISYNQLNVLIQKRSIKVLFAPNIITLNSNPLGSVITGTSVILTCSTGTANPPSKIQWNKIKPGKKSEDITSHSNMDLAPSNFSGVAICSTLTIHDVSKDDHGILYKCIVSHAYLTTEIEKDYYLNVMFPPIIQIYSNPQTIEEGDQVSLHCRTSGGNPNSALQYQFQWRFCTVNDTYQPPLNSHFSAKPTSDIRKYCSLNSKGSNFQKSPMLNISSVSGNQRGWYSCTVHSPGGKTIGYSFLNVLYQPVLIVGTPQRIYAKIASESILIFRVLANPLDLDVKWFFRPQQKLTSGLLNDKLYDTKGQGSSAMKVPLVMKPYGRFESTISDNYTVYLIIRSIIYSDYGDYECEVSNRLGKKIIKFHLYPSNDITIPENSINIQFNGRKVIVHFEPPSAGHFTHLILRICSTDSPENCKDMHISNPHSGKASTTLNRSPSSFTYRILVYNGSSLLQMTNPIQKQIALQAGNWVEMSFEMMVAVIIGVIAIFILLFVALITLILLKCKQHKSKENFVENNSIATTNSHRRQDYFLLNSSANTSLLKSGCHCFSNYPVELRSENGSDHSVPSQGVYHPIMMRRKTRDNGELISIHSGGSCQNPDVILTEKNSIGSGNNTLCNGTLQFNSLGSSTANKVKFLNGRLHSNDNLRQDLSLATDYTTPESMKYSSINDGTSQTRLLHISPKNLQSEYPFYFQMNHVKVQNPYDANTVPSYSMPSPHCIKPPGKEIYRENSSSTNTDSNAYSGAQDPSVVEVSSSPSELRNGDMSQTR